jgi:hypothetical protein
VLEHYLGYISTRLQVPSSFKFEEITLSHDDIFFISKALL